MTENHDLPAPRDNESQRYPVSIKGVLIINSRVLLRKNERDEWELPGGKLELGENPEECVARELQEETGFAIEVASIIDCWVYRIAPGVEVVIVSYGCRVGLQGTPLEHGELRFFSADELPSLKMPEGYKRSIRKWFDHPSNQS